MDFKWHEWRVYNALGWIFMAASADGTKLAAAGSLSGNIFTSTNSGTSWIQTSVPGTNYWEGIASSADGTKLVAVAQGSTNRAVGSIYTSTNSGATWVSNNVPSQTWTCIASSANGDKLVAVAVNSNSDAFYISTNSGTTWTLDSTYNPNWGHIVSSADGSQLMAILGPGIIGATEVVWPGPIYTSQSTPIPQLNIASSNSLKLSWIVPSTNFVLQQNSDLTTTNWTNLTNTPVLNLTNLQNEVMLSPPGSNVFFRLKTP